MSAEPRPLLTRLGALASGGMLLSAAYLAGEWLRDRLGLIVPGNILGMFLMLALLLTGVVPARWVETAASALLTMLPLLFLPIFAASVEDKAFWSANGLRYFAAAFAGLAALWALVGRLAQRFLK